MRTASTARGPGDPASNGDHLAVIAVIVAAGVCVLLRTRLRIGPSIILMGTTLSGLLAASALAFWVSLTYVM